VTATEPEPPAELRALDLRPDGRVVIAFVDDQQMMLRRPTLGQFRRWRTLLSEIGEDSARGVAAHTDATQIETADESLSETDRIKLRRERLRELQNSSEAAFEAWWTDVFTTLAEGPVPPSDDWPPFLVFGDSVMADVLQHWRSVPLAPGVRSNRTS
jgi:hypothetical protein